MCRDACNKFGNLFRLAILAGIAGALTLSIFTATSCELVELADVDGITYGYFFKGVNGECEEEQYSTDDGLVKGARSALIVSMIAGFIAGSLILFEWILCQVCCAGLLEGLAMMVAWAAAGASFMFYGSEFCVDPDQAITGDEEYDGKCEYHDASGYLTGAMILYFGANLLLCCTPEPEPLCKQ